MTKRLESRLSRAYDLILNQPLYLFLPQPVSHTHLAGPVRNGVVDQRDASHMCSVCQTPMGVPVPQAGGGCSAMKVGSTYMDNRGNCSWNPEAKLADSSSSMHWIACWMQGFKSQIFFLNEKTVCLTVRLDLGVDVSPACHLRILLKHGF